MPPAVIAAVAAIGTFLAAPAGGVILFGGLLKLTALQLALAVGTIVSFAVSVATSLFAKSRTPVAQGLAEDRKQLVRGSIEPAQVIYGAAKVSGALVYAASSGANLRYLHLVVVLACHRVSSIGAVWINGTLIEPGDLDAGGNLTNASHPMRGRVRIKRYTGTQTTADADLIAESPDGWSADHILRDQAYLYIRLEYDQERMPGLQEIQAYVEGRLVFDPRNSTTAFNNNWALCVLDYLRSDFGLACADDEIDTASFIAAANLSDEAVPLNAGGTITQPRYRLDGSFKLERTAKDLMAQMLSAGAGTLVYVQGRYRLHGGAYSAPVATITDDDFAGPMEVVRRPPAAELFNGVRGTFIDPAREYQAVEFGAVWDGNARTEDGGVEIWRDIELPFVRDRIQAERLARIMLVRHRNSLSFRAPLKYSAIRFCAWNTVAVTHADFGWSAKPFRLIGWTFDPAEGQVVCDFQEEQASNYTWLWDQASAAPDTPATSLVNPLAIPTPAAPTLTASAALNSDGQSVPSIAVTVFPPAQPFITGMEVEWRPTGGTWQSIPVPPGTTRADIWPVIGGASYEVRTRARTQLLSSAVSASTSITAVSDTTAPAVPTGLAGTATPRGVQLAWAQNADADLDRYRVWERVNAGDAWTALAVTYATTYLRADLTPGTSRRYSISAVDRTGNESARSAEVVVAAGSLPTADLSGQVTDAQIATGITGSKVSNLPTTNLQGTISNVQVASGLDAAKLTTGILDQARITVLDAAKVSGALSAATLPTGNLNGTVTDPQLAGGFAANLIGNACASRSVEGWVPSWAAPATLSAAEGANPDGTGVGNWSLTGFGSGYASRASIPISQSMDITWGGWPGTLPVVAGRRYEWQARIINLGAPAWLIIGWTDASGNWISESWSVGHTASSSTAGRLLSNYTQAGVFGVAPAGAVRAVPFIRIGDWSTGHGSLVRLIWTQALFGEARANQASLSPWVPGGLGQVTPGVFAPGSVTDGLLASGIAGSKVSGLPTANLSGLISDAQIATGIAGSKVNNLPTTNLSGLIADAQLGTGITGSKVSGALSNASLATANLLGTISNVQVASGLDAAKLTTGILDQARITVLDAAKVSGALSAATLPTTSLTGLVSSAQIAGITAAQLTTQITATNIADNAITAPKILAGAITTAKIDTNAVTASKIAVVGDTSNLTPDGAFEDSAAWTLTQIAGSNSFNWIDNDTAAGGQYGGRRRIDMYGTGEYWLRSKPFAVSSGAQYWVRAAKWCSVSGVSQELYLEWLNAAGVTLGYDRAALSTAAGAETLAGSVTAPTGAVQARTLQLRRAGPDGTLAWGPPFVWRRGTGEVIVDGAIIASKLATNAVEADKIAANAVTAAKIQGGAVTADKIQANAVVAGKIAAGAVAADQIQANAITGGKIAADTIATRSLLVAPGNICPDGFFYDWGSHAGGQFWEPDATGWYAEEPLNGAYWQAIMNVRRALIIGDWVAVGTARRHVWSRAGRFMPASAGQQYRLRAKARSSANQTIFCALVFYDWQNTYIGLDAVSWTSADGSPAGVYKEKTVTAPAGSAYMRVAIYNDGGTTFAGMVCLSDIQVEAAVTASMVVQGAITADAVAAGAITAGKLTAASAVITSSLQVQDLILGTTKITDDAITTLSGATSSGSSAAINANNTLFFLDIFPAPAQARLSWIVASFRYELTGGFVFPLEFRIIVNGTVAASQAIEAAEGSMTINTVESLPSGSSTIRVAFFSVSAGGTVACRDIRLSVLTRAK